MLYSFLISLIDQFSFLNVFKYLTFRTGLSLISSMIIVFLIGGPFIKYFSQKKSPDQSEKMDQLIILLKK